MEVLPNSLWPMPKTQDLLAAFDNVFLLSYLLGLIVLLWVSWHRLFREPYSLADDRTDKVLRLMPPGDLRGTLTVLRAYLVYCFLVGGLYSIIALAGSFLWDIAVQMRLPDLAGLSLDEVPFEMDEPAWPLAVGLAFVGGFDRIPKVQTVELTFRRWAYRSIGIPPFVTERTHVVMATELMTRPEVTELFDRRDASDRLHDLAVPLIGATAAEKLRTDLERLGVMQRLVLDDRAVYPAAGLRMRFEPMLREIANDARVLFDEVEGVVLLLGGQTTQDAGEASDREQIQRKRLMNNLSQRASTVHWDMCTLIAVLVENEPIPSGEAHPVLRDFIDGIHTRAALDTQRTDRVLFIAIGSVAAAFLAAWVALGQDQHAPWIFGSNFVSAVIDSLLVALVVLPALITGLVAQDARAAVRRWVRFRPGMGQTIPISQYASVFSRGFLTTVLLVMLFYAVFLLATVNAEGEAIRRFADLWPIFLGYSIIGGLQALAAAYTTGDVDGRSSRDALLMAGMNTLAVFLVMVGLYHVMASTIPRVENGWAFVLYKWFDVLRMALVCGLAIYLTARTTAPANRTEEGNRAGDGNDIEVTT